MKAHRLILFLAFISLFVACQEEKDRVRVVGEISGIKQADFYVYNEDALVSGIDTVKIVRGEFTYEKKLAEPVILTFLYPNFSRTYVIAEPGKKLKVQGEASKLKGLDVSGSDENELLTKFTLQNLGKSDKDMKMAAAQFVRDHSETLAALAVFKRYFIQAENRNATVALPLLDVLKNSQPHNKGITWIEEQLCNELRTAAGKNLPEFSAVTMEGDTITQRDFKGKPLLVVFWAPWSGDSYQYLKTISRIESKNHDKLGLLMVSVDFDKKQSEIRVRQEGINADVVCEQRGFNSPLVKALGARFVPGNLLVSADGEIVKRDIPQDKLSKEIEDLLK